MDSPAAQMCGGGVYFVGTGVLDCPRGTKSFTSIIFMPQKHEILYWFILNVFL